MTSKERLAEYIRAFRSGFWLIGSAQIQNAVLEMAEEIERLEAALKRYKGMPTDWVAVVDDDQIPADAARWRALPAFLEKHQIDYVALKQDIDVYRAAHETSKSLGGFTQSQLEEHSEAMGFNDDDDVGF